MVLVAGNAFFVVGEYAVVTARAGALLPRAEAGDQRARAALRLMDNPVGVISAVQVGITAIGILTGAISEPLVRGLFGDAIPGWLAFALAFTFVTYLTVVFGELVPKAMTLARAETVVLVVARPIEAISVVLRPAVWILERSAAMVLRPLGIRRVTAGGGIRTAEELREAVDAAEREGVIPRAQEEMLHSVFDFPTREARDVMVPASEVLWIDVDADCAEARDQLLASPYTRAPVGRGSLDRVVGAVHLRDLVAGSARAPAPAVAELVRPVDSVPETKDLGAILRELRSSRRELAMVVDEYGRVSGLVTVEDILEEIVGEIEDEFDLPDAKVVDLGNGAFEVSGSVTVDDLNEELGLALPTDGPRTVAGIVFDAVGRLPEVGDRVEVEGVELAVELMAGQKIVRIALSPPTSG